MNTEEMEDENQMEEEGDSEEESSEIEEGSEKDSESQDKIEGEEYDDLPGIFAIAKHILVENEEEATQVMTRLEKGEDFSDLARECSDCPSGEKGGSLGVFFKGEMVPEFEKVAFTAPLDEVQGPVQTEFGYHLILVEERY